MQSRFGPRLSVKAPTSRHYAGRPDRVRRAGWTYQHGLIDNSAGVDCSDNEVNIKFRSTARWRRAAIFEKRKPLLVKMTDDVASLVLEDNRLQSLAFVDCPSRRRLGLAGARTNHRNGSSCWSARSQGRRFWRQATCCFAEARIIAGLPARTGGSAFGFELVLQDAAENSIFRTIR